MRRAAASVLRSGANEHRRRVLAQRNAIATSRASVDDDDPGAVLMDAADPGAVSSVAADVRGTARTKHRRALPVP